MIFPSKYSLLATTSRICVHISRVTSVVPHSPLSSGHAHGGQWAVVSSGLQWSRCDLLHFYRPVIRHTASTTAHHHTDTGISWAYGDWVIFCLCHKICVPLVPVDLRQSPPCPCPRRCVRCTIYKQTSARSLHNKSSLHCSGCSIPRD